MNTYGSNLKMTIFGESGGAAIGLVLDGLPAGLPVDEETLGMRLSGQSPGAADLGGERPEGAKPVFLSGVMEGTTTGAPLTALIRNETQEVRGAEERILRPGHPDLALKARYGEYADTRGNGPFTWRLTSAVLLAGALCESLLKEKGINVSARLVQIGQARGDELDNAMRKEILDARSAGDSVGCVVECVAENVPAGTGGLLFGGMESRVGALLLALPGIVGVEFGAGFSMAGMRGSEANDQIALCEDAPMPVTNNSGGVTCGITNGMPLVLRCAIRPNPSISREQKSVDVSTMEAAAFRLRGHHDSCFGPSAVPVVESAVRFCLLDALMDCGVFGI